MNNTLFSELNLKPEIMKAIDEFDFESTTDIQAKSIPLLLEGHDLVGRSQTGTGKTMAFAIPAIQSIDTTERKSTVQVLVLCPTRELAMQACDQFHLLTKYTHGIRAIPVYGGAPMQRQIAALRTANIVIGTPGRVMDHMRRKTLKLDNLKMLILDEADEMLSMGFKEDIETILQDTPESRQTVLFSATMPPAIMAITKEYQKEPKVIEIDKKQQTAAHIKQTYCEVPMGRKMDALCLLLHSHNPQLAIIFCNTKRMTEEIAEYLTSQGFPAAGLHGDMKQMQRTQVLNAFKKRTTTILVATDVAARGIDVDNIDYVINYDIPQNPEYYIHRIGRTARAGKSGAAITICSGRRQVYGINDIARDTKSDIKRESLPTTKTIIAKQQDRNKEEIQEKLAESPNADYMEMVTTLTSEGFDPMQIAAIALELHYGESKLKIKDIAEERTKPAFTSNNSGIGKVALSIGRNSHVAPNHIVGAVTQYTKLNGSDIGKIEIFDKRSVVSVPKGSVDEVIAAMDGKNIMGQAISARLYADKDGGNKGGRGNYGKRPYRGSSANSRGNDKRRNVSKSRSKPQKFC